MIVLKWTKYNLKNSKRWLAIDQRILIDIYLPFEMKINSKLKYRWLDSKLSVEINCTIDWRLLNFWDKTTQIGIKLLEWACAVDFLQGVAKWVNIHVHKGYRGKSVLQKYIVSFSVGLPTPERYVAAPWALCETKESRDERRGSSRSVGYYQDPACTKRRLSL